MSAAVQMRLDVRGYALPLNPEALAPLDDFEIGFICQCLKLDDEQTACVDEAVAATRACSPGGTSAAVAGRADP